jgi:hypothetical protein
MLGSSLPEFQALEGGQACSVSVFDRVALISVLSFYRGAWFSSVSLGEKAIPNP